MDKKTILIIEDDKALMQAMYEKLSREEDYILLQAYDGSEGLNNAFEKHPDLILLDIVMPKMDGITMLKKLREDPWGQAVPVIILTNLAEEIHLSEELKKHIVGYFIKSDWRLDDIIDKIKKQLV